MNVFSFIGQHQVLSLSLFNERQSALLHDSPQTAVNKSTAKIRTIAPCCDNRLSRFVERAALAATSNEKHFLTYTQASDNYFAIH